MDVEDEKGKPKSERVMAGRRSEVALEHRGDNDEEVSQLTTPNKEAKSDPNDDFELIGKEDVTNLMRQEGEHTD